jgi:hypothetical protein
LRTRGGRHGGGDSIGIQVVGLWVDLHEDRARADRADRFGGGNEGVARRDHLVAGADAIGAQHQFQRGRAAGDANGKAGGAIFGKARLELAHIRPHDERGAFDDRLDGGVDLGTN